MRATERRSTSAFLRIPEAAAPAFLPPSERLRSIHQTTEAKLRETNVFKQAAEKLKQARNVSEFIHDSQFLAAGALFSLEINSGDSPSPVPGIRDEIALIRDVVTDQQIFNAVVNHDFQGVSENGPEYLALLQVNALKEHVARMLVREIAPELTFLSDTEKITIEYSTRIMDNVDEAHIAWYQEVNQGELFTELRMRHEAGKRLQETAEDLGIEPDPIDPAWKFVEPSLGENYGDYLYVMFRQQEDETIKAVPYSEAFAVQTTDIVKLIDQMNVALTPLAESDPSNARGILAVHNAWKELLLSNGSPQEQTVIAKRLDDVWMTEAPATNPGNTVQILYPMESYGDIFQKLVEWDYVLMFKDKNDQEATQLNNQAADMQDRMIRLFETDEEFSQFGCLNASIKSMTNSHSAIYAMMSSGTSLGFLAAASNNPNNADKRREHGSKIRQNMETLKQRADIAERFLEKVFAPQISANPNYLIDRFGTKEQRIANLAGIFVPLHEVGHNGLILDDTTLKLTSETHSNIEEAKADLFSVIGALSTLDTFEEKQAYIRSVFTENLRGLTRYSDTTDRSHYNGDALLIQLMIDAGILTQTTDGTFDFEVTETKAEKMLLGARNVFIKFAKAYDEPDYDEARIKATELFEYFRESQTLLALEKTAGIIDEETYRRELAKIA